MAIARRAAEESLADPVADVHSLSASPRRGRASRGDAFRRGIAPLAIICLALATGTLTFVPMGAAGTSGAAGPVETQARTDRASREFVRPPVPSPSSAPADIPTPTPVSIPAVTEIPSATPTITPSPAAATTSATPTVAPVPATTDTPAPTPTPDWAAKGEPAGSRWSTASVNVRTGPGTEHDVITTVPGGREVAVTDAEHDGWQQVSMKSGVGWVKSSFLAASQPAPAKDTADAPAQGCAKAAGAEKGMKARTVAVMRRLCAQFPSIRSFGGYRAGSSGYHGSGRAIDAMISGEAGWEVARWARANASSLGVVEVIYSQKIWTKQRSGDGWRSMASRGSSSANHYDHVHISVG